LADAWTDPAVRAALFSEAGLWLEMSGDDAGAKAIYQAAVYAQQSASDIPLESLLRLARIANASGDVDGAIDALVKLSGRIEAGILQDELLRAAARYGLLSAGRPQQTVELLAQDNGVDGLRLRAHAAELAGDGARVSKR
jgi:hypothetical protein